MNTGIGANENPESQPAEAKSGVASALRRAAAALSSPKITVVLCLAAIGLVVVGTLAQVQRDIWQVVHDYFRTWFCWVDVKVLFPASFCPWAADVQWDALKFNRFLFPGGALIGAGLAVNLGISLAIRFPVKARGARLVWGLLVLAAAVATTWLVIQWGHNRGGMQGKPPLEWSTLRLLVRIGMAGLWLGCLFALFRLLRAGFRARKVECSLLGGHALAIGALLAWLFTSSGEAILNDSSLRILYQLIQGEFAALLLLAAGILLFRERAGNVLLHAGIALLMFGEFFVSQYAEEQQITFTEGETVNIAVDFRSVDLTVHAPATSAQRTGGIIDIPMEDAGRITQSARGRIVALDDLPFTIEVLRYDKNSTLQDAAPQEALPNPATRGIGTSVVAVEAPPKSGVDRGQRDIPSAYIKLTGKERGEDLGTYLVSQQFERAGGYKLNQVSAGGGEYYLELRNKHAFKPYRLTLIDVRRDDYAGTAMARNYASRVRLTDPSRRVDFEAKIWMNNPLRYAGETFYQSGYHVEPDGRKYSTLQVVKNTGWMIPYASCMIAATGMLWHFFLVLLRFLRRVESREHGARSTEQEASSQEQPQPSSHSHFPAPSSQLFIPRSLLRAPYLVPAVVVLLGAAWIAGTALPARRPAAQMQLERFGALPLMYEGRVKPYDTLARTSLRVLSGRETFADEEGKTQPAIRWLLDVMARPEAAAKHRVFRVDSSELRDTLDLPRRPGARYSWEEIDPDSEKFQRLAGLAQQQEARKRAFQQRTMAQLAQQVESWRLLAVAFLPIPMPPVPTRKETAANPDEAANSVAAIERLVKEIPARNSFLASLPAPLAAPVGPAGQPWVTYAAAKNVAFATQWSHQGQPPAAVTKLAAIFDAYREGNAQAFNAAVTDYEKLLAEAPPEGLNLPLMRFEAYFNHFAPFYNAIPLYVLALVLTVVSWLIAVASPRWSALLRSSAFWLIVLTFAVHTFALAARVVISGRPPVTNLYSSAVFIGWGCVALGLLMEVVFRLGIGNFVSAVAGIGTLIIAHFLAADGDTIKVLQAVLDTQFWLTVHVLTITLGYSAMFLAGALGLIAIFCRPFPWISLPTRAAIERHLDSMIYGSICFAAVFSLVGTVLGGLWADDSWGRFWGWDPKENGALIIVLWAALVLHVRVARMAGKRGIAILAVGGNIVTSWSWFGVNELGVGLHAYGFTEGVAGALKMFWISQLAIVALALLPLLADWLRGSRAARPRIQSLE